MKRTGLDDAVWGLMEAQNIVRDAIEEDWLEISTRRLRIARNHRLLLELRERAERHDQPA